MLWYNFFLDTKGNLIADYGRRIVFQVGRLRHIWTDRVMKLFFLILIECAYFSNTLFAVNIVKQLYDSQYDRVPMLLTFIVMVSTYVALPGDVDQWFFGLAPTPPHLLLP